MSNRQWSSDEKIRIILEGLTTSITMSELCRKHNVSHAQYYSWRERFLEGGKKALATRQSVNDNALVVENNELKQLIADLTIANNAFKKTLMFGQKGR